MLLESHASIANRIRSASASIGYPLSQPIPVGKYLDCYEILLRSLGHGLPATSEIDGEPFILRSDLVDLSNACKVRDQSWTQLFVAAMIWGFGSMDDSGPVKLYRALSTPNAREIIDQTAAAVHSGDVVHAFCRIRNLQDVGPSFGTKFLFACGASIDRGTRPLVLDRILAGALEHLWGKVEAEKRFKLKAQGYSYAAGMKRAGAGYLAYCQDLAAVAKELEWDVYSLEQFLFENPKLA